MNIIVSLVVVAALTAKIQGFATGAGYNACTNSAMVPGHYGTPQIGASPYEIELGAQEYEAGGSIAGISCMSVYPSVSSCTHVFIEANPAQITYIRPYKNRFTEFRSKSLNGLLSGPQMDKCPCLDN